MSKLIDLTNQTFGAVIAVPGSSDWLIWSAARGYPLKLWEIQTSLYLPFFSFQRFLFDFTINFCYNIYRRLRKELKNGAKIKGNYSVCRR